MKRTFGSFINEKRTENQITLRVFSHMIDISPEYLSKIENNQRTVPKDNILEKIANKLTLSINDKEILFDLAAELKAKLSLASDLVEYIRENKIVHKTLRMAKRCKLSPEKWQEIFEYICKKYL